MRFDAVFRARGDAAPALTFRDARLREPDRLARDRRHRRATVPTIDYELGARDESLERAARLSRRPSCARRSTSAAPSGRLHSRAARRRRRRAIGAAAAPEHRGGGFESLIQRGDLSLGVILLSLLIAAFWGSVHALTPGHGKALVAGYLVGTKGTAAARRPARRDGHGHPHGRRLRPRARDARALPVHRPRAALSVADARLRAARRRRRRIGAPPAAAHRRLGRVTSHARRRRTIARTTTHDHHHHGHGHRSPSSPSPRRSRRSEQRATRSPRAGSSASASRRACCRAPRRSSSCCRAIALHRIGFGFALIVAFSLGLAATITGIGLVAVLARRAFGRVSLRGPGRPRAAGAQRARDPRRRRGAHRQGAPGRHLNRFAKGRRISHHVRTRRRNRDISRAEPRVAVVILVAALLGLRHATDPDHIAAVTTLVASGEENARAAPPRGSALFWGARSRPHPGRLRASDPALPAVPARARPAGRARPPSPR